MITDVQLETLIDTLMDDYTPKPVKGAHDIKVPPNDILFGRYLQKNGMPNNMDDVRHWMVGYSRRHDGSAQTQTLREQLKEEARGNKQRFVLEDGRMLVAGDVEPRTYVFPDGTAIGYLALVKEHTANLSAFHFGFGAYPSGEIYFRETFTQAMRFVLDQVKDADPYPHYADLFPYFNDALAGIAIAHELGEFAIRRKGIASGNGLLRELAAEAEAFEYLLTHGMNPRLYELFHLVRLTGDTKGEKSVSRVIVSGK